MYRGNGSMNPKTPSDPFKHPRPATLISTPREGGQSQFDRVRSSPGRQNGNDNGRNRHHKNGGGGQRGGGGNGNRNPSPRKHSHSQHHSSTSSSSQSSNRPRNDGSNPKEDWNGRGQEGFASAGNAAWYEGEYAPLSDGSRAKFQKVSQFGADKKAAEHEAKLEKTGKDWAAQQRADQEKKRKEAEEAAERRKREEDRTKENDLRRAAQAQEDERDRAKEKKRRLTSSSSTTKLASTSATTSSTTSNPKVTDAYLPHLTHLGDAGPAPDLSKALNFVASKEKEEEHKKKKKKESKGIFLSDDGDSDGLAVVTLKVSKKDKGKGKEKEREKRKGEEADLRKKSSKLGQFKKDGFGSSPPKKTKAGNTIISSTSSSSKQKAPKSARQGSLTLEEQFAQERENAEMDAEIARANEEAKREKEKALKKVRKSEKDDSDIEVMDSNGEVEGAKGKEKDQVDVLAYLEEFRKKKLVAMPHREKTPDELLDTQHEEIDPSTLCPFCDSLLPTHPSSRLTSLKDYLLSRPHIEPRTSIRNRKAKYLPIVQIASFCQLHKVETTLIPEGKKRGYPMTIDWDSLPGRIETAIAPRLSDIILGITPSSFLDRAKRDWEKNGGFKRTGVTAEWDSFHFEEPGYYGPRGFELIHSTLRQLFTVDQPLLTPSNIGDLSSDYYLRRVLVPETALELIRLDLKLDQSPESIAKATKVLEESRAFGKAAHGIVEDLKKEHARAKEEERTKQERKEQERIDKIKREKEEREAEARRELEEEEARLAAEVAAAPQYRKPKALAQHSQPKSSNPSTSAPASSSASATSSSSTTKKRPRSPDLNDLATLEESPAVKPKSKSKTQTTLGGGSITSQPSVLAFLSRTGVTKEDLEKDSKKTTPSSCSSATSTTAKEKSKEAEDKQPIILDSSDSSDSDDLQITSPDNKKKKKKKLQRRASSPEKRKRSPSPDKVKVKEKEKKRRASSPTGSPKKKKSKSTSHISSSSSTAPITDQTNSLSARSKLRQALASSDLEEEIETNFKEKNLEKKTKATHEKRSKAAKKGFQKRKDKKDDNKTDRYRGDADSSDSD